MKPMQEAIFSEYKTRTSNLAKKLNVSAISDGNTLHHFFDGDEIGQEALLRICFQYEIIIEEQKSEIEKLKESNFVSNIIARLLCFLKYHRWIVYGYRRCCKFCNKKQNIQEIKEWKDEN